MRTTYDPDADAFYAQFAAEGTPVAETREVAPGVFVDLDETGNLIGFEVLSVRPRSNGTLGKARVAEITA